jgi:protein-S-isoprenylcysteine O-methyltransferase Ste14
MRLDERLVKDGKWLFRWRSFLPLLLIIIVIPALTVVKESAPADKGVDIEDVLELACIAVSFVGLLVRIYTVGHAPGGTSGRNTKRQIANELNTTGAYSLVRNPLYVGNFLITLGVVAYVRVWWLVLIYVLMFWLFYERIIFLEETFLREKFGKAWDRWAARTPVFIPKLKGFNKPAVHFSIRNVLSKESYVFVNIVLAYVFLEVLGGLISEHEFELDLPWIIALCFALVVLVVVKVLKMSTGILDMKGR